jgi:hypothetical protein
LHPAAAGFRGCNAWAHEDLFRHCEAEVANVPADARSLMMPDAHRDPYTLKIPARFEFIQAV